MIRTQSFERALPVIVGFIVNAIGVPVVRGLRACTDGKAVFLPKLPELGLTVRDTVKTIAYVYHECFHILYTNFELNKGALPPFQRACVEVLEDIRIERKGFGFFVAARKYIGQLVEIFTEDGQQKVSPCFSPVTEQDSEASVLQSYMLFKLRHDLLGQTAIEPALAPTVAVAVKMFPRSMMVRLDALMFQVADCDSTDDVFALAEEIARMVAEEKEKQEEERKQPPPPPPGQQPQTPQGGADGSTGGSFDQDDGDDGAGETTRAGQDDGEGGGTGGVSGDENDGVGEEGDEASDGNGAGGSGTGDLAKLLGMEDSEVADNIGQMLEESLNDTAEQLSGRGVSMPNVHPLQLRQSSVNVEKMRASINAVRTRTLQWMSSQAECEVMHSRAGTMLDFTRLHEARRGGEIFVRQDEGIDLNAAVSIIVDRSGSMGGRIQQAVSAALATMLAFDTPGIETQVTVFPAYGCVGDDSYDEGVAVVKRWEESPRHLAGRIASIGTDGGTPMAEAVMFAAADVLRRPETLKIVVVVTDGDPNDPQGTKDVIQVARNSGVAVVGLGIGVDPGNVFGAQHAAPLHDIGQLSGAMVKLIKSAMMLH
jgi:hypothetical protein